MAAGIASRGNTHPTADGYYTKSICPSGGRGAAGIASR